MLKLTRPAQSDVDVNATVRLSTKLCSAGGCAYSQTAPTLWLQKQKCTPKSLNNHGIEYNGIGCGQSMAFVAHNGMNP